MTAKENGSRNSMAITGFKENAVQLTRELPAPFDHSQGLEDDPWMDLKGGFDV